MTGKARAGRGDAECRRVRRVLPALPDGDVTEAARREAQAHLESCERCRREARADLRIAELLRREPLEGVSLPSGATVVTRILEREAARAAPRAGLRASVWAPAAVLAAAAAAAALLAPHGARAPQGPPAPAMEAAEAPVEQVWVSDDEESGRQVLVSSPPTVSGP